MKLYLKLQLYHTKVIRTTLYINLIQKLKHAIRCPCLFVQYIWHFIKNYGTVFAVHFTSFSFGSTNTDVSTSLKLLNSGCIHRPPQTTHGCESYMLCNNTCFSVSILVVQIRHILISTGNCSNLPVSRRMGTNPTS